MNTSNLSVEMDSLPIQSEEHKQRFILVGLDRLTLVFPSILVADISMVERSQILALPFYDPAVMGAIHNGGKIVPLISLRQIMGISGLMRESLTVVRLSSAAGNQAGLGLVVDMSIGMRSREQLPLDLFSTDRLPGTTNSEPAMRLFRPEILDSRLWHPQRWRTDHLQAMG